MVIHEATLPDDMRNAATSRKHSTPIMAVNFAYEVNTKLLLLTHFSSRATSEKYTMAKLETDQTWQGRVKKVILGRDLMTVKVPHGGF